MTVSVTGLNATAASVSLGGQTKRAMDSVMVFNLPVGTHRHSVSADSYASVFGSVEVCTGGNRYISVPAGLYR